MATATSTHNGVDLEKLTATIDAIKSDPGLARFTFRSSTEWMGGGHVRTEIQHFYGAGAEDVSRTEPFVIEGDEPPVLLGSNQGANAVEAVLHALASCLAVGFAYNAAARGINLEALSFELEGNLDLHAFLGLSEDTRPGYEDIRVTYHVRSDAPRDTIIELCNYVQRTSPVLDVLRNPVPVTVKID